MTTDNDYGIRSYIKELGQSKYKPLSKKEEKELLKKYKETKDVGIRNKIVNSNLRYAFSEANSWVGNGLSHMELISEANEGLMESIERFDTSYDNRLGTYAKWWINLKIRESIKKRKKLDAIEVDEELGSSYKDYDDDDDYTVNASITNYDIPIEYLYNDEKVESEDTDSDYLDRVMSSLTDREKDMLNRYFGRGYEKSYTLTQIGDAYGVSKPRVKQIIEVAMKKIRVNAIMEAEWTDSDGE